jgi:hypothetical protein
MSASDEDDGTFEAYHSDEEGSQHPPTPPPVVKPKPAAAPAAKPASKSAVVPPKPAPTARTKITSMPQPMGLALLAQPPAIVPRPVSSKPVVEKAVAKPPPEPEAAAAAKKPARAKPVQKFVTLVPVTERTGPIAGLETAVAAFTVQTGAGLAVYGKLNATSPTYSKCTRIPTPGRTAIFRMPDHVDAHTYPDLTKLNWPEQAVLVHTNEKPEVGRERIMTIAVYHVPSHSIRLYMSHVSEVALAKADLPSNAKVQWLSKYERPGGQDFAKCLMSDGVASKKPSTFLNPKGGRDTAEDLYQKWLEKQTGRARPTAAVIQRDEEEAPSEAGEAFSEDSEGSEEDSDDEEDDDDDEEEEGDSEDTAMDISTDTPVARTSRPRLTRSASALTYRAPRQAPYVIQFKSLARQAVMFHGVAHVRKMYEDPETGWTAMVALIEPEA